jgi:hypothetical protein
MLKTHDNKLMLSGVAGGGGIYNKFSFLLMLDTLGKKINYVRFPYAFDSSEQVDYIAQFKNGNILVETGVDGNLYHNFTLTDSLGDTLKRCAPYAVYYGGIHVEMNVIGGMIVDADSVFVITDLSHDLTGPLSLIKFDTGFHQIWFKEYEDSLNFYSLASILRTSDNGLLLSGTRIYDDGSNTNTDYYDMLAIKLDGNGNLNKKENFNGISSLQQVNNITVYPNPASENLYVKVSQINSPLKLDIFDSRGALVIFLPELSPGTTNIDISTLNKGLYMYILHNETGEINTGKFVKE